MSLWNPHEAQKEEHFKQTLVELGLLQKVKPPSWYLGLRLSSMLEGDRTPIRVKGKPLSQNIMDERR